jgi:hypothetical protein
MTKRKHTDLPAAAEAREIEAKLRQLGLRRVRAYVRQEPSATAARTRKHRVVQESRGLRQINLIVPEGEAPREAVRAVAARLTREPSVAEEIRLAVEGDRKLYVRNDVTFLSVGIALSIGIVLGLLGSAFL